MIVGCSLVFGSTLSNFNLGTRFSKITKDLSASCYFTNFLYTESMSGDFGFLLKLFIIN